MIPTESHSPPRRGQDRAGFLEKAVIFHFATLLIFTSWAFGGQVPWARTVIALWGGIGVLLFFACSRTGNAPAKCVHPAMRWLWPLLLFDLLVGVSGFNPSFVQIPGAGEAELVMMHPLTWLPSAALPVLTWKALWQFNVIVLSCFNLAIVLHSRRMVRIVLQIVAGNAAILAVFGTLQKLTRSTGLWFGAVPSPNPKFFSTFVYHNHWGAFTLLNTAVCLGLLTHLIKRNRGRPFWHTPIPVGAIVVLLLAISVPLSGSRSCTFLMGVLLCGGLIHLLANLFRQRRRSRQSVGAPLAGILVVVALSLGAIYYVGQDVIAQRAALTSEQIISIAREDTLDSRLTLYRDTWRMAAEKPWFGWGLDSYAHVFRIFNTQRATEAWVWIPFYAEAHNDWFQSLAEVGFVGTGLLGLLVLLPLLSVRWRRMSSNLPRYLLAGCALILLYAWVEFPFANPAVVISFWCCLYSAVRYAKLSSNEPNLPTPPLG